MGVGRMGVGMEGVGVGEVGTDFSVGVATEGLGYAADGIKGLIIEVAGSRPGKRVTFLCFAV